MNKKSFVPIFLEFLSELGNTTLAVVGSFRRESMDYKYLRLGGHDPHKIYSGFRNLEHRGIIRRKKAGEYNLTSKGRDWYRISKFRYKTIHSQAWDEKWRIIIFDIPMEFNRQRNNFRNKLRSLGFYMLQKSIFVFPYDCISDIGYFTSDLGISEYVDFIVAESIGFKEKEIKKFFGLK